MADNGMREHTLVIALQMFYETQTAKVAITPKETILERAIDRIGRLFSYKVMAYPQF